MRVYRNHLSTKIKKQNRAIAIGIFDGVHLGHKRILKKMIQSAKRKGLTSMVITFDPHPSKVLNPLKPNPILMALPHRLKFFESLGIEETLVIHFDKKFSKNTHEYFLNYLINRLGMRSLTVGYDFCFGFKGHGNVDFLKKESKRRSFEFNEMKAFKKSKKAISSTLIRQLIEKGNLKEAEKMLGRRVSVFGTVIRGRGRGKKIGFPTANLDPHHETLPPCGVYAAWGLLGKKKLRGVIHIGERPTFGDKELSLEVHFLSFHKSIYGRAIELFFVKRLRGIRHFASAKALKKAIQKDTKEALLALYK